MKLTDVQDLSPLNESFVRNLCNPNQVHLFLGDDEFGTNLDGCVRADGVQRPAHLGNRHQTLGQRQVDMTGEIVVLPQEFLVNSTDEVRCSFLGK